MASPGQLIEIRIAEQTLTLSDADGATLMEARISSAKNGVGQEYNSERTPCGRHLIRAKIGAGQPANSVFVSRRPTGEIYSPQLRALYPQRDWILTRILWLSGLEPGKNRSGRVDTMRRYIYIHGAPDEDRMGVPSSHGCIKMKNSDVIQLFDLTVPGTRVNIICP